ncbi:phosphotransferase [Candidatus Dependentiae bacterium]|nr:phosphotransferase [Candidatus Dependentiae bacterium]
MSFKKNIINLYGQKGQEWLNNIPNIVNNLSEYWELSNLQVMPNLSYNYVLSAIQKNIPVILKISFDKKYLEREINALNAFSGSDCVGIISYDIELGALLLQKMIPGTSLKKLFPNQDEKATKIICDIIKNLHSISISNLENFPNIFDWLKILDKNLNLPKKYLIRARELKDYFFSKTLRQVLLHGDLHYDNILWDEHEGWVAIDPKGVLGNPIIEVASAIYNPIPELLKQNNVKDIILNRINLISNSLNLSCEEIIRATYLKVVLSTCWAVDENINKNYFLNVLKIIDEL